jgi:hypothetical protein
MNPNDQIKPKNTKTNVYKKKKNQTMDVSKVYGIENHLN